MQRYINLRITEQYLDFLKRFGEVSWVPIADSPLITREFIEAHPEIDWVNSELCLNPNIDFDFINNHPEIRWDTWSITRNPNLKFKDTENLNYRWDFHDILASDNITLEDVENHPGALSKNTFLKVNKKSSYRLLKENSAAIGKIGLVKNVYLLSDLTWEIVLADIENFTNTYQLFINPNISRRIVEEEIHKTEEFSKHFPDSKMVWSRLSRSPAITWELVQKYPELPWNFLTLSLNPNVTYQTILENPDKAWSFPRFYMNHFTYQAKLSALVAIKEWQSSNKIKRWFVSRFWNPDTHIGRKRLQSSYQADEYSVWKSDDAEK